MEEKNITFTTGTTFTFDITPKYVGRYRIGGSTGLQISFEKKPKWIHRKMMRLCLGWEWVNH
jgi:hypothetical protein